MSNLRAFEMTVVKPQSSPSSLSSFPTQNGTNVVLLPSPCYTCRQARNFNEKSRKNAFAMLVSPCVKALTLVKCICGCLSDRRHNSAASYASSHHVRSRAKSTSDHSALRRTQKRTQTLLLDINKTEKYDRAQKFCAIPPCW